ncbi:hypothetical protein [Methylobacterium sp. WL120]|uniref:hypothetical protein n=1 Tax=Methylobacterium sp. WL120 TaxID=2603887 RepID=UPI0011C98351|nr:hypothetical protein [Methylobacterium sp. WL120]TXM69633.1 hypothetical protein FV229_04630 [Methylobacterium sp. WL120]
MNIEQHSGSSRAGAEHLRLTDLDLITQKLEAILGESGSVKPDGIAMAKAKRWLQQFPIDDILNGIEASFAVHLRHDADGDADWGSALKSLHKVDSFIRQVIEEKTRPYIGRIFYAQGVIRNRLRDKSFKCFDAIEQAHLSGVSMEVIEAFAKTVSSREEVESALSAWGGAM